VTQRSLFGREDDLAVLRSLLDEALDNATESGRALVLTGQAGVGKTALLDEACSYAHARGARVSRIAGAEFDVEVSFSALGQLLRPFVSGIVELRKAEAAALTAALDLGDAPAANPLAICHAALALLLDTAKKQPLLLVVDDLPWVDRASAQVLTFIARRLIGVRIGVLAAARVAADGLREPSGLPHHDIKPLSDTAAAALLAHHFPAISPRTGRRLLSDARGNPLALLELPATLSTWEQATVGALPDVLPLSQRLHDAFVVRVNGLPAETRRALLVAALDGTGELRTLRAVAPSPESFAPAERSGLVRIDDTSATLTFSHPLIRAAVVAGADQTERRTVHRLLADAHATDPGRHAWHLAEAATGPDEQVAALLQAAAHVTMQRGDPGHAIKELLRSADLSPTSAARSTRMAEAAYLGTVVAGELHNAPRLLDIAEPTAGEPSLTIALATANHLLNRGDIVSAHEVLVNAIRALPDPGNASDKTLIEVLYNLLLVCVFGGGRPEQREPLRAAFDRLAPRPPELLAILDVTFGDPVRSSPAVLARLDAVIDRLSQEMWPARIIRIGTAAAYVDRLPACREALTRVVGYGRAGGPVTSAIEALFLLANDAFFSGQWTELESFTDEGLALCEQHGYQLLTWPGRFLRALLAAARGEEEAAPLAVSDMSEWAHARQAGLIGHYAAHVGALHALGRCDFEAAYGFAASITPPGTIAAHVPHALWTILDTVEAALRTGRRAEAAAHASAARAAGMAAISPRLAFVTAVAEALTAPDGRDCELFAEALATPGLDRWSFDLARAQLSYGERLRRYKMTALARTTLTSAVETFQRLGARPWADRARSELRAAGQTLDNLRRSAAVVLTPQQHQIAHLAAEGQTNKQIGERLLLSPRTVSSHLYELFPKLGIASRAALRDALTQLREQGRD
jgi:DNA-binding CsgD family transcriptional regulator